MSDFRIDPANSAWAMERIIEGLTDPQRLALVVAFRQGKNSSGFVVVAANERTIGSLRKGHGPLIMERRGKRVMTGLGEDVARYLTETRTYNLPDLGMLISNLPDRPK